MFDSLATKTEDIYAPVCEILDLEKHFTISLDVPGIKKEDIDIDIEIKENQLYVSGERKSETMTEQDKVVRSERTYGKFSRSFTLPANVKADAIGARFENGVLELTLPKEEKTMSRKIEISDLNDSALKN